MALTLREAVTATQTTFDVDGSDALSPGELRSIGDEVVEIRAAVPQTLAYSEATYQRLTVYRGQLGSGRAAHDAEAALEAYSVSSAAATVFYDDADPGAVGAGAIWLRPEPDVTGSVALLVRNEADDGWITPTLAFFDDGASSPPTHVIAGTFGQSITLLVPGGTGGNLGLGPNIASLYVDGGCEVTVTNAEVSVRSSAGNVTMPDLPTSDPTVAGALWNDTGTLKVSAG